MSLHPNDKKSFKIFKKIKTPSSSPFISRKGKTSDRSSLKSSDIESAKSSESEVTEKTPELRRSSRSPKFKSSSLRKLFKKSHPPSKRNKSSASSDVSDHEGNISFNHIVCSTPLINPAPDYSSSNVNAYSEPSSDTSPTLERMGSKPEILSLPAGNGQLEQDQTDRSDESGIFSPSPLEEHFTPPLRGPADLTFTPPSICKSGETEYTPPSGFRSEPIINQAVHVSLQTSPSDGKLFDQESSGDSDKAFSRFRIPAIELTKPKKPGSDSQLAAETNYISPDCKSVDSLKDVSTLKSFLFLSIIYHNRDLFFSF
jgi:hypothetical protein